jgi:hypothetical protein
MDPKEPKITQLPDDWRLKPGAARKRALFSALSPADQKRAVQEEKREKARKKRQAILRNVKKARQKEKPK